MNTTKKGNALVKTIEWRKYDEQHERETNARVSASGHIQARNLRSKKSFPPVTYSTNRPASFKNVQYLHQQPFFPRNLSNLCSTIRMVLLQKTIILLLFKRSKAQVLKTKFLSFHNVDDASQRSHVEYIETM